MQPACGPKKGHADRPEPGRPRQARLQAARPYRHGGPAARRGGHRGQHPRQPRPHSAGAGHPFPARRSPAPPAKLHADKGYDYDHLRTWLRQRRITPRIARRGVKTSDRLGRHRWVIERSLAWLTGYRRLTLRYELFARLFTAFLTLAATLTCYKRLPT